MNHPFSPRLVLKLCATLLIALVVAANLRAQVPGEPLRVPLKFACRASDAAPNYDGTVKISLCGQEAETSWGWYPNNSPVRTVYVEPGKTYTGWHVMNLSRPWEGGFFAAPPGYAIYVNGKKRTDLGIYGQVNPATFTIRVVNEATFAGPVGEATSFTGGRILWQVSAGKKRSQEHAGNLMISYDGIDKEQWDMASSPLGLYFETNSTESVAQNKILTLRKPMSGKNPLRQVYAPQATIDIITSADVASIPANAYVIRFFHPSQASAASSTSNPVTFTGLPFVEYLIENIGAWADPNLSTHSGNAPALRITKTRRTASASAVLAATPLETTTILRRTIDSNNRFVWRIEDWWEGAAQKGRTVVTHTVNLAGTEETIETASVDIDPTGASVLKLAGREVRAYTKLGDISSTAANRNWYAVSQVRVESEGGASPLTAASQTDLLYYDNDASSETASRGFLYGKVDTGGVWEYYDYSSNADIFSIGQITKICRPFLNQLDPRPSSSTSSDRVGPAWTAGAITTLSYSADENGMKTRLAGKVTKVDGKIVEKETRSYSAVTGRDDLLKTTIYSFPSPGSSVAAEAAAYVETISVDYKPSVEAGLQTGRPFALATSAGQKTSFIRQWVKRGNTANTFTAASDGKLVRMAKVEGTVGAVPANPQTGAAASTLMTSYDGFDLGDIHVVDGMSTLSLDYFDEYCNLIRSETKVWKGSWQPLQAIDYTYNLDHTLIQRQSGAGELHTFTVSRGRVDSETGADGASVAYTYDQAGRVKTVVKSGYTAAGFSATPALTTTYDYDGADRVVSETLSGQGTSETISSSRLYDLAGRVRVETAPGGYSTITTYSPDIRKVSVSAPFKPASVPAAGAVPALLSGTLVTTRTLHADGRLQSEQTTGLPADTYTYAVQPNGHLLTRVDNGPSTDGRFVETITDGLGRPVSTARPRPLSGGVNPARISGKHTERNYYNNDGQLIRVSRGLGEGELTTLPDYASLLADTLYAYDVFGRAYRSGLDINGNGVLDLAGPDRVSETDERMQLIGTDWWLRKESFAYIKDNSADRVSGGYSLSRLTGLSAALASETKAYDAEGNESRVVSAIDRATRTVTVTRSAAGITASAVDIAINGFALRKTTPEGLVYSTKYDALGRAFESTAPRIGTSETIYVPGTPGTVDSVKDTRGVTVASYQYDGWGRVNTATDAAQKKTYTSYTPQGQVHRVWGPAAMPVEYGYNNYGARTTMKTFRDGSRFDQNGNDIGWNAATWPSDAGTAAIPAGITSWDYDVATGLLMAKRDALTQGDSTRGYVAYEYDSLGRVKIRRWGRALASGSSTRVSTTYAYYPGSGDLASKDYNDDTPDLAYEYTRSGQVKTVTDSTGTRVFAYDPAKPWRLQTETLADGYQFTQLYEDAGTTALPDSVVVPGRARGFRFGTAAAPSSVTEQVTGVSGIGRLSAVSSSRPAIGALPAVTQVFRYTYRTDSPLLDGLAATGTGFSVSRTYETSRNLLTGIETKWDLDVRVRHRYISDDAGRRRHAFQDGSAFGDYGLGASEGLRQDYDYDDLGQLKTVKSNFAQAPGTLGAAVGETARSVPDRQYGYAYDQAGNRTGAAFKHSGATAPPQTAFYDAANQLERRDPGPAVVRGLADSNTQVAVEDIDANAQTKAEQVEKVGSSNYWHKQLEFIATAEEWRRHGRNIFIGALRSGAANQESRFVFFQGTGATMEYDADGNLTEDDKWKYTWDAENRLIRQQSFDWLADAGAGPRLDISYRYDYLGRRVSKHVFTLDATGTPVAQTQSQYYYDGWNLVAEATMDPTTAQPVFRRTYTWGLDVAGSLTASGGVGALLQIADHADGQRYFPAYDGNGNVSALLNAASGAVAASYEYSPYGESLRGAAGGIAAANPFRFSTKFTDNETGLVYYGMRYYDPAKGRFINRDPIEERGGLNLYGFCGNDGVNRYDVLGMWSLKKMFKKLGKWFKKNWRSIVGAALNFIPGIGTALSVLWSAGVGYAYGGVEGMLTGAAAGIIGSAIGNPLGNQFSSVFNITNKFAVGAIKGALTGGFSGGASSLASGRSFGEGFAAGAITGGVLGGVTAGIETPGPDSAWGRAGQRIANSGFGRAVNSAAAVYSTALGAATYPVSAISAGISSYIGRGPALFSEEIQSKSDRAQNNDEFTGSPDATVANGNAVIAAGDFSGNGMMSIPIRLARNYWMTRAYYELSASGYSVVMDYSATAQELANYSADGNIKALVYYGHGGVDGDPVIWGSDSRYLTPDMIASLRQGNIPLEVCVLHGCNTADAASNGSTFRAAFGNPAHFMGHSDYINIYQMAGGLTSALR